MTGWFDKVSKAIDAVRDIVESVDDSGDDTAASADASEAAVQSGSEPSAGSFFEQELAKGVADPRTLLTPAVVEEVLGAGFGSPSTGSSDNTLIADYRNGELWVSLSIIHSEGEPVLGDGTATYAGLAGDYPDAEPVSGIGDQAVRIDASSMLFRAGNQVGWLTGGPEDTIRPHLEHLAAAAARNA